MFKHSVSHLLLVLAVLSGSLSCVDSSENTQSHESSEVYKRRGSSFGSSRGRSPSSRKSGSHGPTKKKWTRARDKRKQPFGSSSKPGKNKKWTRAPRDKRKQPFGSSPKAPRNTGVGRPGTNGAGFGAHNLGSRRNPNRTPELRTSGVARVHQKSFEKRRRETSFGQRTWQKTKTKKIARKHVVGGSTLRTSRKLKEIKEAKRKARTPEDVWAAQRRERDYYQSQFPPQSRIWVAYESNPWSTTYHHAYSRGIFDTCGIFSALSIVDVVGSMSGQCLNGKYTGSEPSSLHFLLTAAMGCGGWSNLFLYTAAKSRQQQEQLQCLEKAAKNQQIEQGLSAEKVVERGTQYAHQYSQKAGVPKEAIFAPMLVESEQDIPLEHSDDVVIRTGDVDGVYHTVCEKIRDTLKGNVNVFCKPSKGTEENVEALKANPNEAAIVQQDTVNLQLSSESLARYESIPLMQEYVWVLAHSDAPFSSLADMEPADGHKIVPGNSGALSIMDSVKDASRTVATLPIIRNTDVVKEASASFSSAVEIRKFLHSKKCNKKCAVMLVSGYPSSILNELNAISPEGSPFGGGTMKLLHVPVEGMYAGTVKTKQGEWPVLSQVEVGKDSFDELNQGAFFDLFASSVKTLALNTVLLVPEHKASQSFLKGMVKMLSGDGALCRYGNEAYEGQGDMKDLFLENSLCSPAN